MRRNARQGTGRTKTQYYTYVAWRIRMPPKRIKEFCRRRLGIESSYRMYNPVRDPEGGGHINSLELTTKRRPIPSSHRPLDGL